MNGNYVAVHIGRLTQAAGRKWDPNNKLGELAYKEAVLCDWKAEKQKRTQEMYSIRKTNNKDPS